MTQAASRAATHKPTVEEILLSLREPIPPEVLQSFSQGGASIVYAPWHEIARLLDERAPGWEGHITPPQVIGNLVSLTYAITLHGSDRSVTRSAAGTEELDKKGYGDSVLNAEASAFRRAAAKLGLGLDLYRKDGAAQPSGGSRPATNAPRAAAPAGDRAPAGTMPFGKSKGQTPAQLEDGSLEWYLKVVGESVEDPSKTSFRAKNEALYNELYAEAKNRGWEG